jgi:hypothetical protein
VPTVGFLPPQKSEHHPALIASFGLAREPEPGVLRSANVEGVHLTLLASDGKGKAATKPDKVMVGPSNGWPIVLTPITDALGMGIAEGVETALSLHNETGLGVWAAGCANRLPGLADKVPSYVEVVNLAIDQDPTGQRENLKLAERLHARGIEVRMVEVQDGA